MSLLDILACPVCKACVRPAADRLCCTGCGRYYPVVGGVPVMLPDAAGRPPEHEGELRLRAGYDPWVHRAVIQSLADDQVVVDCGCGNMTLDDPCIVRMDVKLTPYVDVVGDVHALPFRPGSVDFFLMLAVVEHLRQPFQAADEIFAALKPGGYVYGDCNFVFPYHGYPHHYFNATVHGLREVFGRFRPLSLGVAPFQMPSFALEGILAAYCSLFVPRTRAEGRFLRLLRQALRHPVRAYDARLRPGEAFRLAAGSYFLGVKQPAGGETVLPPAVMHAHAVSAELQARYPDPYHLGLPDTLMHWARTDGIAGWPDIAAHFVGLRPFSKYADPARSVDRSHVRALPPTADPTPYEFAGAPAHADQARPRGWRQWVRKGWELWRVHGSVGVAEAAARRVRRRWAA